MTLKSWIQTGSLAATLAPLIDGGQLAEAANIANAKTTMRIGSVSRASFAMWCGVTGLRASIEDQAHTQGSPLRSVSLTLLDFLQGGVSDILELDRAENQAMLQAWVTAGALTQQQEADLLALATTPCSEAEKAGFGVLTAEDIGGAI